jgi:hypothetical protein
MQTSEKSETFIKKYGLVINSIAMIIVTGLLTTILHELAHFIPAYFFGFQPELHHNFVNYDDTNLPADKIAIVAAAGPIVSLILGLIFLAVSKQTKSKGFFSLFMLWMGLQGYLTFFGYLFIAPFFTYGDTGKVFDIIGLPFLVVIAISIFGIVALNFLYKIEAKEFRFYGSENMTVAGRANALIFFPVLGSIASGALQLPVPTFLSLLAPIMMPLSFMSMYGTFRRTVKETPNVDLNQISWLLVIVLILTVTAFRLLNYPAQ